VSLRGLITVLRKETTENIRDRRAIFNSLLLGPILFPLMFIGIVWFTTAAEQERAEATLEIPVVGAERAPSLVRFLEQQGVVIKPAPEDPEARVRSQEELVIIRVPEEFTERWNEGQPAPVEVIADPSRQESQVTIRRVRTLLAIYGCAVFLRTWPRPSWSVMSICPPPRAAPSWR
jgi:sodium transport system permease protein